MAEIKFGMGTAALAHERNLSRHGMIDNRFTTPKKINSYSSVKLGILGAKANSSMDRVGLKSS